MFDNIGYYMLKFAYDIALDFCKLDMDSKLYFAYEHGLLKQYSPNIDEEWLEKKIWQYVVDNEGYDELIKYIEECKNGEI